MSFSETESRLWATIQQKQSYLCVGLDPDPARFPAFVSRDPEGVFSFCRDIVDATLPFAVAYKINTAFFETLGAEGWILMDRLFAYIRQREVWTIADAKRGDIGNTSQAYARAFFETLGADALTLSPYMGQDSVQPFLEWEGKTAIVLALTSNPGHADFEILPLADGRRVFEAVLERCQSWPRKGDLMFVVGATRADEMQAIRKICPERFLLVPGVGAQGGDLKALSEAGLTSRGGLLVNASRSILYASSGPDFAEAAALEAHRLQVEMKGLLEARGMEGA